MQDATKSNSNSSPTKKTSSKAEELLDRLKGETLSVGYDLIAIGSSMMKVADKLTLEDLGNDTENGNRVVLNFTSLWELADGSKKELLEMEKEWEQHGIKSGDSD